MKMPDSSTSVSPLLTPSSLILKTNKSLKPFKFNRRLKNRMNTLLKNSSRVTTPIKNYQIVPVSSPWINNTQVNSPNPTVTLIKTSPTPINVPQLPVLTSSSINSHLEQNTCIFPSYQPYSIPRVTTTLIPLNVGPTEYSQPEKPALVLSTNMIEDYHDRKSTNTVQTHFIGEWTIRESSEPFQRRESEQTGLIERINNREKNITADESTTACSSSLSSANRWTVDDVCAFFERVLGKTCYASIIKEHLIDGVALLLLEEEHLTNIFKMPLGPRLKLLNGINKLKNGDVSER